jgi:hypothetical protein
MKPYTYLSNKVHSNYEIIAIALFLFTIVMICCFSNSNLSMSYKFITIFSPILIWEIFFGFLKIIEILINIVIFLIKKIQVNNK